MLLAEANQWPEDAVAYFGEGDESHMNFHFPLMPRMFMSLQMEDRFPIIDILEQTPPIPENCQWAMFLRNHDELTLEMVTDEERDYMWRVYANDPTARINLGIRRRLAPLLANSRRKIELLNILLFSMPGTPVLYYGDEIGMGDNFYLGDRNGCRTPMQWSSDRNAGFSKANPQQLYLPITIDPEYHYEAINVENQQKNLSSLLWWMRRVIAMRKNFKAFSRGSLEFLLSGKSEGAGVPAAVRRRDDSRRRESFAFRAAGGARSLPLRRLRARWKFSVRIIFRRSRKRPIRSRSGRMRITGSCFDRKRLRARVEESASCRRFEAEPNLRRCSRTGSARCSSAKSCRTTFATAAGSARRRGPFAQVRIIEEIPISAKRTRRELWFLEVSYTRRRDRNLRAAGARSRLAQMRTATSRNCAACGHRAVQSATRDVILHDAVWDSRFREELFRIMATATVFAGKARRTLSASPAQRLAERRKRPASIAGAQRRAKQFLDAFRQLDFS